MCHLNDFEKIICVMNKINSTLNLLYTSFHNLNLIPLIFTVLPVIHLKWLK